MNYSYVKFQKVDVFNRIYFTKNAKPRQSETHLKNHQLDFFDKNALSVGRHFLPKDTNLTITLILMETVKNTNQRKSLISFYLSINIFEAKRWKLCICIVQIKISP